MNHVPNYNTDFYGIGDKGVERWPKGRGTALWGDRFGFRCADGLEYSKSVEKAKKLNYLE